VSAWSLEQKKLEKFMLDLQLSTPAKFCYCKENKNAKLRLIANSFPQRCSSKSRTSPTKPFGPDTYLPHVLMIHRKYSEFVLKNGC